MISNLCDSVYVCVLNWSYLEDVSFIYVYEHAKFPEGNYLKISSLFSYYFPKYLIIISA